MSVKQVFKSAVRQIDSSVGDEQNFLITRQLEESIHMSIRGVKERKVELEKELEEVNELLRMMIESGVATEDSTAS